MKKILSLTLAALMLLTTILLSACGGQKTLAEKAAAGETIKIGVIQLMPNPSLDNCREGILAALEASDVNTSLTSRRARRTLMIPTAPHLPRAWCRAAAT